MFFIGDLSWLKIIWLTCTSGVGIAGLLGYYAPKIVPFLTNLVKYGKSQSAERSPFYRFIELPKRYFTHFYIVAAMTMSIGLIQTLLWYVFDAEPSMLVRKWLRTLAKPTKTATVDEFAVLLTMTILWFHVIRRLLESLFVSVYSNTNMNIIHYLMGLLHYVLLPITVLSEAPGFLTRGKSAFSLNALTYTQIVGLVLFLLASYQQHRCLNILGDMRRNYLGNITTYAHGIPVTYWFEYVSCPHFLFEILIYAAFYLTLNLKHSCWAFVFSFVITNQILAALITHEWYKEKFRKLYPTNRRALVPFVL